MIQEVLLHQIPEKCKFLYASSVNKGLWQKRYGPLFMEFPKMKEAANALQIRLKIKTRVKN